MKIPINSNERLDHAKKLSDSDGNYVNREKHFNNYGSWCPINRTCYLVTPCE